MAKREVKRNLQAAAKILGRRGGEVSGSRRMKNLTPEERGRVAAMGGKAKAKKEKEGK